MLVVFFNLSYLIPLQTYWAVLNTMGKFFYPSALISIQALL